MSSRAMAVCWTVSDVVSKLHCLWSRKFVAWKRIRTSWLHNMDWRSVLAFKTILVSARPHHRTIWRCLFSKWTWMRSSFLFLSLWRRWGWHRAIIIKNGNDGFLLDLVPAFADASVGTLYLHRLTFWLWRLAESKAHVISILRTALRLTG